MKSRIVFCVIIVSMISLSMCDSDQSGRYHRQTDPKVDRQKRQQLTQQLPMDWPEEEPYSEEEGIGNAVDNTNSRPVLPPAPEVPVEPHQPLRAQEVQRGPEEIEARSNADYMDDFMKDMGIPKEGEQPSADEPTQGQAGDSGEVDIATLVELCDQPVVIASANRFSNTTIRLFRNNDFWDLMGVPDRQGFVSKKQKISPPLAPVDMKTSIVTILSGPMRDLTYKFSRNAFWAWNDTNGQQISGGKGGERWMDLPSDARDGFEAMVHNGDEAEPMIIAFKGDKVWYIKNTNKNDFEFVGDEKGYESVGKYKENWPKGLTAAFTYPLAAGVSFYLFKEDKHCVRSASPLKSGAGCDEWRDNFELFGCKKPFSGEESTKKPENKPDVSQTEKEIEAPPPPPEPESEVKDQAAEGDKEDPSSGDHRVVIDLSLVLFAISLLLFTNILY